MSSATIIASIAAMFALAIGSAVSDGRTFKSVWKTMRAPKTTPPAVGPPAVGPPAVGPPAVDPPAVDPSAVGHVEDGSAHVRSMWTCQTVELYPGNTQHLKFIRRAGRRVMTVWDVVILLINKNESFVEFFSNSILQAGFSEVFLCTPRINAQSFGDSFEIVLKDASGQIGTGKPSWKQFDAKVSDAKPHCSVTSFENLGKDAVLVVPTPCPGKDTSQYGTLCGFLRTASDSQKLDLWHRVATEAESAVRTGKSDTIWIVTHGQAVPWLHVRIDFTSKYVQHDPWK